MSGGEAAEAVGRPILNPALQLRKSGLELMEMLLDGRLAMAPIAGTLGFRLVEVARERAAFEGRPVARIEAFGP